MYLQPLWYPAFVFAPVTLASNQSETTSTPEPNRLIGIVRKKINIVTGTYSYLHMGNTLEVPNPEDTPISAESAPSNNMSDYDSDPAKNPDAVAPRPRRRTSILANASAGSQSQLNTRQGRRKSIADSSKRINDAPVNFSSFGGVIDDSGHTMLRRSSMKQLGSKAGLYDLDNQKHESLQLYRPRRNSLAKRDIDIPVDQLAELEKLASMDDDSADTPPTEIVDTTRTAGSDLTEEENKSIKLFMKRFGAPAIQSSPPTKAQIERKNRLEKVKFAEVEIREYGYTLGDNPSVSSGAPLSILWEPMFTESITVDEYEKLREGDRRMFFELKIPTEVRFERLKDAGMSTMEIAKGIRSVDKCRIERLTTKQTLYLSKKEERNEKLRRGLRNFFTNHKKKETEYLDFALSFAA